MVITKENIQNAQTYMNIGAKQRMAEQIAGWVVKPVEMTQDDLLPIPPVYKENRALKNILMMGILCKYYLQLNFECDKVTFIDAKTGDVIEEKEVDYYPSMGAFDEMAQSAIMNQLERLKKNEKEISNIIFDLLYDYKTLEQMVNAEIKDYLNEKNDTLTRMSNLVSVLLSQQQLEKLKSELEVIKNELEEVESSE